MRLFSGDFFSAAAERARLKRYPISGSDSALAFLIRGANSDRSNESVRSESASSSSGRRSEQCIILYRLPDRQPARAVSRKRGSLRRSALRLRGGRFAGRSERPRHAAREPFLPSASNDRNPCGSRMWRRARLSRRRHSLPAFEYESELMCRRQERQWPRPRRARRPGGSARGRRRRRRAPLTSPPLCAKSPR